jgi:hypothetical protein
MEWLRTNFPDAHSAITNLTTKVVKPVQTALPSIATDKGSATMLGVPQEGGGMTCTGGRRGGKTRKGKKSRKTRRGGKYY